MKNREYSIEETETLDELNIPTVLGEVCLTETIVGNQPACILPSCDYAPDCANTGYCHASERN